MTTSSLMTTPAEAEAEVAGMPNSEVAYKTELPVIAWRQTSNTPRGVVLMLHGITQRAQSLDSLGKQLSADGYLVYGLDERGFGWWHAFLTKKDKGYRCDFKSTVKDTDRVLTTLKEDHPNLPIFLIGESVGAAIAWRATADCPDIVDGLIVAGSGCRIVFPKLSWMIGDTLKDSWRWGHQIDVTRYQLRYASDDIAGFKEMMKDPEQRNTISTREIVGAELFLKKNRHYARRITPHTAVLVIQGSDDRVLSPKSAARVYSAANTANKRMVSIPNCGHMLLGMPALKPLVSQSITTFLDDQVEQLSHAQVASTAASVSE